MLQENKSFFYPPSGSSGLFSVDMINMEVDLSCRLGENVAVLVFVCWSVYTSTVRGLLFNSIHLPK